MIQDSNVVTEDPLSPSHIIFAFCGTGFILRVHKVAPRAPGSPLEEARQLPLFHTLHPYISASRTREEESYPVGPAPF